MNDKTRRPLLKSLFFANFVTLFVSTIIVAVLIYVSLHNMFMDDISKKDRIILDSLSRNVEYFLTDSIDALEYIDLMLKSEGEKNISAEIDKHNQVDRYFENIEILDLDGTVTHTMPGSVAEIGHTRNGEDYYKNLSQAEMYWSKPFISSASGNATVVISMMSGQNIIVGFLDLSYLNQLTSKTATEMGSNFQISILDNDGIFISSNDMTLVEQRRPIENFNQIESLASTSAHATIERNNTDYLLLAKTLNQTKWHVVILDDYSATFESYQTMINIFIVLLLLSLIIYLTISFYRTSKITKNISQFLQQTEEIAEGNYAMILPKQRYEEFQKLASNFELMIQTLKLRDRELVDMAYHDSLTGLVNWAYLYNGNWLKEIETNQVCCLVYFDLDNFKNINDNYGHLFGDELLQAVADRIIAERKNLGITARIGGDEFVIIFSCNNCPDMSTEMTQRILDTIQKPIELNGKIVHVTASAGITYTNETEKIEINSLLKQADIALYEAKKMGKNSYQIFSEDMDNRVTRRLLIEHHLREALHNKELHLAFQPQYILRNNSIRGFEALLRWENPSLGTVSPDEFIPIAEETGMIVEIGRWVMKTACETVKQINAKFGSKFNVSVNVSPYELNQLGFLKTTLDTVSRAGLDNSLLEIEITESVLLDNTSEIIEMLAEIRRNNIKVSLDDFGTGYSSLSYLNKLPITTLKIDKSFIQAMLNDEVGKRMVDSIIIMGHHLGLEIVAEGVETQLQDQILSTMECDCIQGYFYSKPLLPEALEHYLKENGFVESLFDQFMEMLCGKFDNKEQFQKEAEEGNPIHPLAKHIIGACNHKMMNLPVDFTGQFVIEESYFDLGTHQVDKHYLFLYEMISDHQIRLTSYNIPEHLNKETFTNANTQIAVDYATLEISPRFSPLILELSGDSFVGENVSKFSEEHIFKFRLEVNKDALYVTEILEKNGELVAGYYSPTIYKIVKEELEDAE